MLGYRPPLFIPARLTGLVFFVALVCSLFLAVPSIPGADNGTAEALYRRGLMRYNEGKFIAARLDFSEVVAKYRTSPRITTSYMFLAKIYYTLGECNQAAEIATELRKYFPRSGYNEWAQYLVGACQFRAGKKEDALKTLARLAGNTRNGEIRQKALRAVRYVLLPELDQAIVQSALKQHGIAISELDGLEPYAPSATVPSVELNYQPEPEAVSDSTTVSKVRETGDTVTIGLLAPLTGVDSLQGSQLLAGVKEALNEKESVNGKKIRLVVEDTESDMITAYLKMKQLADEKVIAVIGPVYGESTVTAAIEANNRKIPFIAPTAQNSTLTEIGRYVFQLNFNPVVQAEALAELAVKILGFSNLAVIATKDEWGQAVAEKFVNEVRNRGAHVVKTAFVDQNVAVQDINPIILSIRENAPHSTALPESTVVINNGTAFPDTIVIKLDPSLYGPQRLIPINSIDGILISAVSHDAVQIAQYIMDYNITTVLLGDSGWSSENFFPEDGGAAVDGAYIVSLAPDLYATPAKSRTGLQDIISLKGYDACRLIVHCLENGAEDPESLVKALESVQNFQGRSSRISIGPKNHANHAVDFLRIQNGTFVKIPFDITAQ